MVLFCEGCISDPVPETIPPSQNKPIPTVKVIQVDPTATPVPTATPTPFTLQLSEPLRITDLSQSYNIEFPSCFDLCEFEADTSHISSIYTGSVLSDVSFTITYFVKETAPKEFYEDQINGSNRVTEAGKTTEIREITLPKSYFTANTEGMIDVLLVVTMNCNDTSLESALKFSLNSLN
ncbi:MAG: hypothetical protein K6F63_06550 [Lachnospiraceae bacterium]|nr:hypothetical protein [Lachnospiraceae bacterium]